MISETSDIKFTIRILQGNGEFLVFEGGNIVCTGRALVLDETGLEVQHTIDAAVEEDRKQREESKFDYLTTKEIYKELRIRGYDYGPKFHGLHEARSDGQIGLFAFFLLLFVLILPSIFHRSSQMEWPLYQFHGLDVAHFVDCTATACSFCAHRIRIGAHRSQNFVWRD